MKSNLLSRVDRIEATLPTPTRQWRCIHIVCDRGDLDAADALAKDEGYGLDDNTLDYICVWENERKGSGVDDAPFKPYVMSKG